MACIFVGVFVTSHITKAVTKYPIAMDANRTLNIYLSVILTFFAGIVSMCITIFKCHDNPNGERTLTKDESIICGEDKWNNMLVVAILSCAVYIVAFGTMC